MPNLNLVFLEGHVGQDPELRYTSGGNAVANFSMATSTSWKDKQTGEWQENTEWHRVTAWRESAEYVGSEIKKGMAVHVEGSLKTRSWNDKDGNERKVTEIEAKHVYRLGYPQKKQPAPQPQQSNDYDDDLPF